jgi:ketosteroid isomerase-like protein
MRKVFIIIAALFISCQQHKRNTAQDKQQMIKADRTMNDMAAKEGFNNAILYYADSNIVKFEGDQLPVIGKAAFAKSFDKNTDLKSISWKPVNAEVAESGDLGYTWGNWKMVAGDTTYYGNYFTAWKKQKDGSWKVALDGGNSTPKPE